MRSTRFYFKIMLLLMALLCATVGAAYVDLGPFNTVVAMLISLGKAALIAMDLELRRCLSDRVAIGEFHLTSYFTGLIRTSLQSL